MALCPYCGAENIEGADECEQCAKSLEHLSKPRRAPGVEDAMFRDRVGGLVHSPPIVVEATTTVDEVLKLLVEKRIGCVVVVREGEAIGIFSERDALLRIGDQIDAARSRPIREFMTENPVSLDERAKLAFAVHQMDVGHFRHVPVLRDGQLHGVISARDVLRYLTDRVAASG